MASHSPVDYTTPPVARDAVRLNEIQVVGSHNSYKEAMDPAIMDMLAADDTARARALDYAHPPLDEQLDLGLRSLELDVYYDPDGGRYAHPFGRRLAEAQGGAIEQAYDPDRVMHMPGFKVLHIQDIDFRSNCLTLKRCLATVRAWSADHPDHVPLIITVNAKDDVIDQPGFTRPLPFDESALHALDAEIRMALGTERLITPDDVRGSHATLEAAVQAGSWPTLSDARGRVMMVLDEGGEKIERYRTGHPSLRGRVMFANYDEGSPEAAFRIINDPIRHGEYIAQLVSEGYMVRTRADANTVEAREGDTRRRDAAFSSGAHVVTTDYYRPDPSFGTGYAVFLPGRGVVRCNPVASEPPCPADLE